jgi:phage head maturation protease
MTSDGDRERRDIKKLVQVGRAKRNKLVGYGSLKNSRKLLFESFFRESTYTLRVLY